MARSISDEELQLKRRARRRLIGAIVLVAAIVVVLPMVLDTEPKRLDGEISIKIPPPESGKYTARMVPVPPSAEPRPAAGDKPAPDPKSQSKFSAAVGEKAASSGAESSKPLPAPAKAEPPLKAKPSPEADAPAKPVVPTGDAPAKPAVATGDAPAKPAAAAPAKAEMAAAAPAASDSAGQQYAVQVVALADADKVKEIRAQMAAAGLKSYTEVVKTAKGEVTRVRAGPYADRAAAEKAHDQLKTIGLSGNIVTK